MAGTGIRNSGRSKLRCPLIKAALSFVRDGEAENLVYLHRRPWFAEQ